MKQIKKTKERNGTNKGSKIHKKEAKEKVGQGKRL